MYRVSSYINTSESLGERKMLWENLLFCLPTLSRLMQLFFISSISITPSHSIEILDRFSRFLSRSSSNSDA